MAEKKQTKITDYFRSMATLEEPKSIQELRGNPVQEGGEVFLNFAFQFYVILSLRITSLYGICEICEVGIVVTKREDRRPLYRYNKFVKPTILRISNHTQKYARINIDDVQLNFSQVLHEITQAEPLIAHALQNGLLVVQHEGELDRFYAQCAIEQAFRKNEFPNAQYLSPFDKWCAMDDMYNIATYRLNKEATKIFFKRYRDLKYNTMHHDALRCVDKAQALVPAIDFYVEHYGRDLFPTVQLLHPRTDELYIFRSPLHRFQKYFSDYSELYEDREYGSDDSDCDVFP